MAFKKAFNKNKIKHVPAPSPASGGNLVCRIKVLIEKSSPLVGIQGWSMSGQSSLQDYAFNLCRYIYFLISEGFLKNRCL
jgi:hypothetical protein